MSSFTINVQTSESSEVLANELANSQADQSIVLKNIQKQLKAVVGGANKGSVNIHTNSSNLVAASATLTLTSAIATDAVTIGSVTMVATSTPTLATHWEIDGADDTADAASLAAAINANTTLNKVVVATSAGAVVTVTCHQKGILGNQVAFSSADATIVASSAFLAGGTGGPASAAVTFGNI